jgi:hypothetical protein
MSPHGHAPLISVTPRFACTGNGWHRRETRNLPASMVAATEYKGSGGSMEERRRRFLRPAAGLGGGRVSQRHGPAASSTARVTAGAANVTSPGRWGTAEAEKAPRAIVSSVKQLWRTPRSWHVDCNAGISHVAFPPITWRGWQQGGAVRTQQPRSSFPGSFPRRDGGVWASPGSPARRDISFRSLPESCRTSECTADHRRYLRRCATPR